MALRKPPLRQVHADRGAKFTEFGGWDMPVEFDSIRTEHEAVRESAGVFDVSHMGQIEVSGPDAGTLTNRLTTNDVSALDPGKAQYSAITDDEGIMLDDTIVYRLPERDAGGHGAGDPADSTADAGEPVADGADYLFVPNAGHDEQMHDRWTTYRDDHGLDAVVEDATGEYAMFALQGPDAVRLADEAADGDVPSLSRLSAARLRVAGTETLVSRTGYTGEDGVELLVPRTGAETVWSRFVGEAGVQPCGLGARDTLRIEAGFLLSGQDFDPATDPRNPYEAGIGFVVDLGEAFVGRDALARVEADGVEETFVGFRLTERGVPRHGYDIVNAENRVIGRVTSGTMSPTLDRPIGMGYLPTEYADPGTTVRVVVRGQRKNARVQSLPFYKP